MLNIFFFKQKTAYEMRISDWSSDVCSSDLRRCDTGASSRQPHGDDSPAIHAIPPACYDEFPCNRLACWPVVPYLHTCLSFKPKRQCCIAIATSLSTIPVLSVFCEPLSTLQSRSLVSSD